MVVPVLPMGLGSAGRNRLVVGRKLRVLPVAWPSRETSTMSARTAAVLALPSSLPASMPATHAHSHSAGRTNPDADSRQTHSNPAASRPSFADAIGDA